MPPHHDHDSDAFSQVYGWRCPVCNATAYRQTMVARPDGRSYLTEFFECAGCTLMFRHPGRFTRLGMPIRRWAMDVEPRSLAEAHGLTRSAASTEQAAARSPGQLKDGKIE